MPLYFVQIKAIKLKIIKEVLKSFLITLCIKYFMNSSGFCKIFKTFIVNSKKILFFNVILLLFFYLILFFFITCLIQYIFVYMLYMWKLYINKETKNDVQ